MDNPTVFLWGQKLSWRAGRQPPRKSSSETQLQPVCVASKDAALTSCSGGSSGSKVREQPSDGPSSNLGKSPETSWSFPHYRGATSVKKSNGIPVVGPATAGFKKSPGSSIDGAGLLDDGRSSLNPVRAAGKSAASTPVQVPRRTFASTASQVTSPPDPAALFGMVVDGISVTDPKRAQYIKSKLHPLVFEMVQQAVKLMPLNPVAFFLTCLLARSDVSNSIKDPLLKCLAEQQGYDPSCRSQMKPRESMQQSDVDTPPACQQTEIDDLVHRPVFDTANECAQKNCPSPGSPKITASCFTSSTDLGSSERDPSEDENEHRGERFKDPSDDEIAHRNCKSEEPADDASVGSSEGSVREETNIPCRRSMPARFPSSEASQDAVIKPVLKKALKRTRSSDDNRDDDVPKLEGLRPSILKGSNDPSKRDTANAKADFRKRKSVSLANLGDAMPPEKHSDSEGETESSCVPAPPVKRTWRKMSVFKPLPKIPHDEILRMISKVDPFQALMKDDLEAVAQQFHVRRFDPDEEIEQFGQHGGDFHIIYEGDCRVSVPQQIGTLAEGDCVGAQNLMKSHLAATKTVTAAPDSTVVTLAICASDLDHLGLKKKFAQGKEKKMGRNSKYIGRKVTVVHHREERDDDGLLAGLEKTDEVKHLIKDAVLGNTHLMDIMQLTEEQVEQMVEAVQPESIPAGKELTHRGSSGDRFYIVHDGLLEITDFGARDLGVNKRHDVGSSKLRSGDSFGELCLLYNTHWRQTVMAVRPTVVWVLERTQMREISRIKRALREEQYLDLISSVTNIAGRIDDSQKQLLAKSLEEQLFLQDEVVVTQGEPGNTFYIIFDGECAVTKSGVNICTFQRGDHFGERALLTSEPRSASVTVTSETATLLCMEKTSFDLLLSKELGHLWLVNGTKDKYQSWNGEDVDEDFVLPEDPHAFQRRGILGAGSFGVVTLEDDAEHGKTYAMKRMSKGYIVREGLKEMVKNERTAMLMMDSPFCVKLFRTYKDDECVFFLMEPLIGGELFYLFSEHEDWFGSEAHARFFSCCVSLGLEHMHALKLVYRDLKLENVLLNSAGYAKLIDFGLAKVVYGKTYTVCGTADYFAPETLRQQGHNRAVDWWALGILLFIMMSGRSPFDAEDVMTIYKNIAKGFKKELFPSSFKPDLVELIKGLCRKKPEERLPMSPSGAKALQEHPWYVSVQWDKLRSMQMDPPWVPNVDLDGVLLNGDSVEIPIFDTYVPDGSNWDVEF